MTLANQITLSRIILAFLFMFLLFLPGWLGKVLALVVFIAAALTDLLDGRLARGRGEVTDFGVLMDPIADKVLVLAAFLAFLELKLIAAWMVVLIVARELLVTGLRLLAASKGLVLGAERGGKHKTVSQQVAIITILVVLVLQSLNEDFDLSPFDRVLGIADRVIFMLMLAVTLLTLGSGIGYIRRNWEKITRAAAG
ncbi:MAG: CDP-diacylglycerol--glycerol-3-phosphate 3-phosphatidyltransferase [Candidatus Omnitrophica bacterium]|nr:CDP-diacylglycerol--glycerol-3-phosphate 3-phosphatidyltransferase [Candidatus Omnitrophota bacterium]